MLNQDHLLLSAALRGASASVRHARTAGYRSAVPLPARFPAEPAFLEGIRRGPRRFLAEPAFLGGMRSAPDPPASRVSRTAGRKLPGHLRDTLRHRARRAQRYIHGAIPVREKPACDDRPVVADPDVLRV